MSLLTELQRVSNSTEIFSFIYLLLSTKHCFKPCSKGEISIDCTYDKFITGTLLVLLLDCFGQRLRSFLFLVDN